MKEACEIHDPDSQQATPLWHFDSDGEAVIDDPWILKHIFDVPVSDDESELLATLEVPLGVSTS